MPLGFRVQGLGFSGNATEFIKAVPPTITTGLSSTTRKLVLFNIHGNYNVNGNHSNGCSNQYTMNVIVTKHGILIRNVMFSIAPSLAP